MNTKIETIKSGSVTSPGGFNAGATYAGIKKKSENALDLAILFSETLSTAAGVFTTNCIKAAPVVLSQEKLKEEGKAVAVVVNSGCANACTGERGLADARETVRLTAIALGASPDDVLVASTGVIGVNLPVEKIREGIDKIVLSPDGGHKFARAIMTTDTVHKEIAVKVRGSDSEFIIGGAAKGAGMIHPQMATMLGFLTTDAAVEGGFLTQALKKAVDASFNMISVDGDSSTNDTVFLLANGKAGNKPITVDSKDAVIFQDALEAVCIHLAKSIVRDGEGATKMIEVVVGGAASLAGARQAARTIVSSTLLKAAIHGNDPNWGRVLAALGRSGVEIVEPKINLYLGDMCLVRDGAPLPFVKSEAAARLDRKEVQIIIELNMGWEQAIAWGCDLTAEYVKINAEYTT
ncbi:bifunctional glutamate N-acetyltransferase/amino-acid acetyltransferase ArgJ [Chloroflexota bacterium]